MGIDLGYEFNDIELLGVALNDTGKNSGMDPLEFLGDGLLEILILRICKKLHTDLDILKTCCASRHFLNRIGYSLNLQHCSLDVCNLNFHNYIEECKSSGKYKFHKNKYFVDRLGVITGAYEPQKEFGVI